MRIVVNDIAAQSGGALSILKDFDEYIRLHDDSNEWIYLLSGNYIEERSNAKVLCFPKVKKSWRHRIQFDLFETVKLVNKMSPDVYISLQNVMPRGIAAYRILYVHQPIPFQNKIHFSLLKKRERIYAVYQYFIGFIIKRSIGRSDRIIVQTEWMKQAIDRISKKNNVIKITPTANIDKGTDFYDFKNVHFFYPTSDVIYKNIKLIESACNILDKKQFQYSMDITVESSFSEGTSRNINYIGRIDRKEVFKRYRSSVLVFPSYIESFGYPLAEARESGAYILASDCDFAHELLDGYPNVSYFDPFESEELALLMENVLNGKYYKKTIALNSLADRNSWKILYNIITCEDKD